MSISLDLLESFVKVADHLSVSVAAQDLGIGKGLVSKRVAQLEQSLGATLFSRSTRKVALTPAGDIYLEFARNTLLAARRAEETLRNLRTELTGQLRVTAPISWGQRVLAKVIPEFCALYPGIEIELLLDDRMMDLAHERVDIALRMTATLAPDLVSTSITRLDWVTCASPTYLAARGSPSHPDELIGHPCMSYWRVPSDDAWQFHCGEQHAAVRIRSRYRANNPEAVNEAALAGLGIALLPLYVCREDLMQGRLMTVLSDWVPFTKFGTEIMAVTSPERVQFSRNQFFIQFLKQRLEPVASSL